MKHKKENKSNGKDESDDQKTSKDSNHSGQQNGPNSSSAVTSTGVGSSTNSVGASNNGAVGSASHMPMLTPTGHHHLQNQQMSHHKIENLSNICAKMDPIYQLQVPFSHSQIKDEIKPPIVRFGYESRHF